MAIMINLLPDVRIEKIREQQRRRFATTIFAVTLAVCGAVMLGLFIMVTAQNLQISNLTSSISEKQSQIKQTPDLSSMLTLQQQLAILPKFYQNRVYMSKFVTLMQTVAPKDLGLTAMAFDGSLVKANVTASSYVTAMKFVRSLEASKVTVGTGENQTQQPAFTDVTMSAVSANGTGKVTYEINAVVAKGVTSAN